MGCLQAMEGQGVYQEHRDHWDHREVSELLEAHQGQSELLEDHSDHLVQAPNHQGHPVDYPVLERQGRTQALQLHSTRQRWW
jgi:hypothetical protein